MCISSITYLDIARPKSLYSSDKRYPSTSLVTSTKNWSSLSGWATFSWSILSYFTFQFTILPGPPWFGLNFIVFRTLLYCVFRGPSNTLHWITFFSKSIASILSFDSLASPSKRKHVFLGLKSKKQAKQKIV